MRQNVSSLFLLLRVLLLSVAARLASASDRRLITAFFGEYNYELEKVDQNPYLSVDCVYEKTIFEECDRVFMAGGNFIEDGVLEKIGTCENRPMYKHVDANLYVYSRDPVGWIVTREACGEDPKVLAIGLEDDVAARVIKTLCTNKNLKEAKRRGGTFASALTMIEPLFKDHTLCQGSDKNYRKIWQDLWETIGETKRVEVNAAA